MFENILRKLKGINALGMKCHYRTPFQCGGWFIYSELPANHKCRICMDRSIECDKDPILSELQHEVVWGRKDELVYVSNTKGV